jgi:hypothetical protein
VELATKEFVNAMQDSAGSVARRKFAQQDAATMALV